MTRCLRVLLLLAVAMPPLGSDLVRAQEDQSDTEALIDFARDIQPILEARCISCHGPEEAKNDFRIDDLESIESYVEPGDLESSSMWADYLISDDPDMLMPPATDEGPGGLHGGELAVIKLWIEEGAKWDWLAKEPDAPAPPIHTSANASVPKKLWTFQGLFHPASVHFPIALLMVSGLFTFLSFFGRSSFEPVAFHCLWIGALGAVASSVMGWSYAVHEGYGTGFTFDLLGSAIDRHRWLGIAVAVLAILLIPVAHGACKTGSFNKRVVWFLGAVLLALGVSITGYQGGELTYGEDHYVKEFERLFPAQSPVAEPSAIMPDRSELSGDAIENDGDAASVQADDAAQVDEDSVDEDSVDEDSVDEDSVDEDSAAPLVEDSRNTVIESRDVDTTEKDTSEKDPSDALEKSPADAVKDSPAKTTEEDDTN